MVKESNVLPGGQFQTLVCVARNALVFQKLLVADLFPRRLLILPDDLLHIFIPAFRAVSQAQFPVFISLGRHRFNHFP